MTNSERSSFSTNLLLKASDVLGKNLIWVNEGGQLYAMSAALKRKLGYDEQKFGPQTVFELTPQLHLLAWKEIWETLRKGQVQKMTTELISRSNDFFPVNLQLQMLSLGEESLVVGSFEMLSERPPDSLDLYKQALDQSKEIILWINADGALVYANFSAVNKLCYPYEELLKTPIQNIVAGLPASLLQPEEAFEFREQTPLEVRLWARDGRSLFAQLKIVSLQQNGDSLFCLFFRDYSSHRHKDEVIRLMHHTVNQLQEIVYWCFPDGRLQGVNETFCRRLGFSYPETKELRVQQLFLHQSADYFDQLWKTLRQNRFFNEEMEITTKDGHSFPVENTVTLITFQGQEMACVLCRDISERKSRETEVKNRLEETERKRHQLEAENTLLREEVHLNYSHPDIITQSDAYRKVLQQIEQVADTNATVLLLGETGTGKELLARTLHQLSSRSEGPLVKVNCGALPATLIESELFGHEKGAFTGANHRKPGRFERADKGTIFLDEIGELPLDLQVKLLRVLQEGELERVGGESTIKVDVRVVAATNRNLEQLVREKKFRADLFYRLNVFPVVNLPLRERKGDIPLLANHFIKKYSLEINKPIRRISPEAMTLLERYAFPGNVRELENIIERAIILCQIEVITAQHLFFQQRRKPENFPSLEEVQRKHIQEALHRTSGRVSGPKGAAELLNINDKTLISRMKKLGIDKSDFLEA